MPSMSDLKEKYIDLQNETYSRLSTRYAELESFNGKTVRIAYCCGLVCNDLDELYYKRHFNFCPSLMALTPNPETTIPLSFCLYLDKLPAAYAMGDISLERNAFELHFIETSNFFGQSGLSGWLHYVFSILVTLSDVIEHKVDLKIDTLCIVGPAQESIGPLTEMGFDFINDYQPGVGALVYKFSKV